MRSFGSSRRWSKNVSRTPVAWTLSNLRTRLDQRLLDRQHALLSKSRELVVIDSVTDWRPFTPSDMHETFPDRASAQSFIKLLGEIGR